MKKEEIKYHEKLHLGRELTNKERKERKRNYENYQKLNQQEKDELFYKKYLSSSISFLEEIQDDIAFSDKDIRIIKQIIKDKKRQEKLNQLGI
jgi:hypothetical protein